MRYEGNHEIPHDGVVELYRVALLRFMEALSEHYWNAGWLIDLETRVLRVLHDEQRTAYRLLIEAAGGRWTWPEPEDGVVFVEGSFDDLGALVA